MRGEAVAKPLATNQVDDQQDRERDTEEPEEGIADLSGLAEEGFDAFHDTQKS